ncbi:hypothetical protein BH11PAT1_BH11PAT1_0300 [soil metagenome]
MENEVIFTNKATIPPPSPAVSSPTSPVPPVLPTPLTAASTPPLPPPSSGRNKSLFIRIGIGIGVLLVVVILISVMWRIFHKEQVVSLTLWGLWDDPKVMQEVIGEFEKKHPLIKISYVKQDLKQYRERLTTRIPSGTGPDIYYFHNTWTPMLSRLLAPLPLDVISPATFQQTYYPVAQTDLVRNGAIYGLPLGIDTLALFVNTDLQKAAGGAIPQNWDDFKKAAQQLTARDGGNIKTAGAAIGTIDNISHSYDVISLLFVQNGVDLRNFAGSSTPVIEALKYYTNYATGENSVWDSSLDPSLLAFSHGNLAYFFGYSWDIFNFKALNPTLPFAVYPVPSLPSRTMTIASYWAVGIAANTKQQKAAGLFVAYLTQKDTAQKLYTQAKKTRGFGMPYARLDLADTLKDDLLIYPFIQQAKGAVSSYFASDTFDNGLNTKMNAYLGNAVRKILDNNVPESVVEELTKGVIQVQNDYGR